MPISEITNALPAVAPSAARVDARPETTGSDSVFGKLVSAVESTTADANTAVSGMLDGQTDVHDAMIALQKADMTLQLSMQVRNKLVQAYQEIMRMSV